MIGGQLPAQLFDFRTCRFARLHFRVQLFALAIELLPDGFNFGCLAIQPGQRLVRGTAVVRQFFVDLIDLLILLFEIDALCIECRDFAGERLAFAAKLRLFLSKFLLHFFEGEFFVVRRIRGPPQVRRAASGSPASQRLGPLRPIRVWQRPIQFFPLLIELMRAIPAARPGLG